MPFKPDFLDDFIRLEIEGRTFELFMKKSGIQNGLCEGALNSTDMLDELKNYDLIIYYGGIYCAPLVGEFLNIPRVEIFPYPPNILLNAYHMTPMPVSYVPQLIKPDLTDKMTFGERVINLVAYLGSRLVLSLVLDRSMNNLKIKFNIKPERSFQEAIGDAEMVIITADFALEYPVPLLPGIQVVFWSLSNHDDGETTTSSKTIGFKVMFNTRDDSQRRFLARCNIVAILFRMVATLFQYCNAVLR